MNGNFPRHGDADDGLDPELTQLFDSAAAPQPAGGAVFVSSLLLKMQHTRRLRLVRQVVGVTVVMVISAFLAPYVAQQTLRVASWLAEPLPATDVTVVSAIGCILALIAWRMTRWTRS
jgi:hypothetical protein